MSNSSVRTGKYNNKLFSAKTVGNVMTSHGSSHYFTNSSKYFIAFQMAICIVDSLEAINIDHKIGAMSASSLSYKLCKFPVQTNPIPYSIQETSKSVRCCLLL